MSRINSKPKVYFNHKMPNCLNHYSDTTYRFCIAPMMDWSDTHCRYFWRIITKKALLYTEMVTTGAIIHGDRDRFLRYNRAEHPIILQLGGSNPQELAQCARIAQDYGYNGIDLNCGCPSDRVQEGKIGAILMQEPELVADCVKQMQNACNIPISVKHRIGVDNQDDYSDLNRFVSIVSQTGCNTFTVHARKAWLKGLSPKQNREVPPLQYERVYQLKKEHPKLRIILNGGITSLEACEEHLRHVDGVMMGREAYHNPFILADVDRRLFGCTNNALNREEIGESYLQYVASCPDTRLHHMTRHILGLYHGQKNGKLFRRFLSENATLKTASDNVLKQALKFMQTED